MPFMALVTAIGLPEGPIKFRYVKKSFQNMFVDAPSLPKVTFRCATRLYKAPFFVITTVIVIADRDGLHGNPSSQCGIHDSVGVHTWWICLGAE